MIVAIVKLKIYWRRLAINKYIILNSGKSCEGNEWSSVREKNDEVPRRPLWQGVTEDTWKNMSGQGNSRWSHAGRRSGTVQAPEGKVPVMGAQTSRVSQAG